MLSRGLVRTGVPGVAVRFDDGRADQIVDIRWFLDRGIPVTVAINAGSIGNSGRLTWSDLRELIGYAKNRGTTLSVATHGATNWSKYLVGDPAVFSNYNFGSYTWQDFLDEVSPATIERELGVAVVGYVHPGDANVNAWGKHNAELIEKALRAVGLDYAVGLYDVGNLSGTTGSGATALFRNSSTFVELPLADIGNLHGTNEVAPGTIPSPYQIPDAFTADLGSTVVPRGVDNGAAAPLRDPNSGADGWLLGEDNNGAGAEGHVLNDADRTLQWRIARALGVGAWHCIALHSEASTNVASVVLSTGTQAYPRHWSSRHVAWLLDRLEAAGHIRLLSLDDWAAELWSDFEEGTDILANPSFGVPLYDAGEESIADLVIPRGFCAKLYGNAAASTSTHLVGTGLSQAAAPLLTAVSGVRVLENFVGPAAAALAPRVGMPGALVMKPTGDFAAIAQVEFLRPNLTPGLYRFDVEVKADAVGGGRLAVQRMGIVGSRLRSQPSAMMAGAETLSSSTIPEFCVLDHGSTRQQIDVPSTHASRLSFLYDCNPARSYPMRIAKGTENPGSIADAATFALADITVAGARLGASVFVIPDQTVPDGVSISATVTATDTVSVSILNDSGAPWAPGSTDWFCYVEDVRPVWADPAVSSPATPWLYTIALRFDRDGAESMYFGSPSLTLLKRY